MQSYAFGSARGPGQVLCGANVNGKAFWRLPDGQTFKDWQEGALAGVVEDELQR